MRYAVGIGRKIAIGAGSLFAGFIGLGALGAATTPRTDTVALTRQTSTPSVLGTQATPAATPTPTPVVTPAPTPTLAPTPVPATPKPVVRRPVATKAPVATVKPRVTLPPAASNCDPNYAGVCVPNVYPSDVDCAGGSGNGPYYVAGPVRVIGTDHYQLDRDGDGVACE